MEFYLINQSKTSSVSGENAWSYIIHEPIDAINEMFACHGTTSLNGPVMCCDRVQFQQLYYSSVNFYNFDFKRASKLYFAYFLRCQRTWYVLFICKNKQSSASQSLIKLRIMFILVKFFHSLKCLPPLIKAHEALFCNRSFEFYLHYQLPKWDHQWTQNSCANMNVKIFVHPRPIRLAYNFKTEWVFLWLLGKNGFSAFLTSYALKFWY